MRGLYRLVRTLAAFLFVASVALGQGAPPEPAAPAAVPAFRQADRVVIIPIDRPIDAWVARSVERRIAEAEAVGADAIVFELDTPGGEVGAVLRITTAIKSSSITNTVAWVHPNAYSGGAVIALACREIVVSSPSALGDAFQIIPTYNQQQGRTGLRAPTADERTKILPVIMSDVVDSARRNGHDEFLVQAMVIDGVELWLIEDTTDGRRYCVNETEYRAIFADDPPKGAPLLTGVTGARYEATDEGPEACTPVSIPPAPKPEPAAEEDGAGPLLTPAEPTPESRQYRPASPELEDVAAAFSEESTRLNLEIQAESERPDFAAMPEADASRYRYVARVCDGTSAVIAHEREALALGLATRTINNDRELEAFFGARSLARSNMSWSEHAAAFMTLPIVRGLLIVVFLIALCLEMFSPGLVVPGTVAVLALIGLMGPPLVVGMAGWWEILAIGVGFVLLAIEVFVLPGFGVFGALGLVSLFVGLVGTFIPANNAGLGNTTNDLIWGSTTVLLSFITGGVVIFFIARHAERIPFLDNLILRNTSTDESAGGIDDLLAVAGSNRPDARPAVGDVGLAITPLRPSGSVEIDDRRYDASSGLGFIDAGARVRVVRVDTFALVVEPEATA